MLRMRILLADNDLAVARVLARQLEKNGYTVQVVNNGIDALKHLETHRYDVAILERELPEMDGILIILSCRRFLILHIFRAILTPRKILEHIHI